MRKIYGSELLERQEQRDLILETGLGLESIRFAISDNLDELNKQIEEAREDLKYFENPHLYLHGPYLDINPMTYDSRVRRITRERYEECYEAAVQLQADGIVFHSCMNPLVYYTIGWADRMVEFWNEFMEGKTGITLVMENVYDREIPPFVDVAKQIQHPDFGICLDIGHAHCYSGRPVKEWLKACGPYIKHLHLHDNDQTEDHHVALGQGTIDVDEVFTFLKGLPQDYTITLECQRKEDFLSSLQIIEEKL